MALVVENGTGLSTAESYVSVADATARHAALGNAAWAALDSDTIREQALRRATNYMVQTYRSRWAGSRINSTQALDWPRYDVSVDGYSVDSNIVPADIVNACADLALKASTDTLNADLERAIIREKVGPLETEYSAYSPQRPRYPAIDGALAPYLTGSASMASLVRA